MENEILELETGKEVVIVSVGQLTNIANLLKSKPDQYSPLNGMELVQKHGFVWDANFLKKRKPTFIMIHFPPNMQSHIGHALQQGHIL